MKLHIDIVPEQAELELIIRCAALSGDIQRIQRFVQDLAAPQGITGRQGDREVYLMLESVLFFETEEGVVFAHTAGDSCKTEKRLYELEQTLPRDFIRISKSAIVNVQHIYALERKLTSASVISFYKSPKQLYSSRMYFKPLRERLSERRASY